MKPLRTRNNLLAPLVSLIAITFWVGLVFAQENEDYMKGYKRYWIPRLYPRDSIPGGAYENAFAQLEALRQSSGYQFPSGDWILIGPKPLDAWGNLMACRVNNIKYDPRDPSHSGNWIWVTGEGGGLWKTEDGGVTWVNKSGVPPNELPMLSAGAFALDDERGYLYFGSGGMGIFRSTDEGASWTSISAGLVHGSYIYKIAIHPDDNSTLFAATWHGLFKTTTGGSNWFRVIPPPEEDPPKNCTDVCFSRSGGLVFAIGNSYNYWPGTVFNGIGLWRSTNGGENFQQITESSGFPHQADVPYGKGLLAVSQADENFLYVVNYDNVSGTPVYLYKSTNAGDAAIHFDVIASHPSGIPYHALMVRCSDANPNICFLGYEYLDRTTNGGENWDYGVGGYTNPHADYLALDFNPFDANKVTVGCDGGAFRSDNLGYYGSWISKNQDLGSLSLIWYLASNPYEPNSIV